MSVKATARVVADCDSRRSRVLTTRAESVTVEVINHGPDYSLSCDLCILFGEREAKAAWYVVTDNRADGHSRMVCREDLETAIGMGTARTDHSVKARTLYCPDWCDDESHPHWS